MPALVHYTDPTILPHAVACAPLSPGCQASVDTLWWGRNFTQFDSLKDDADKKHILRNRQLIAKVLAFAGHEMCMPTIEEDWQALMTRGAFLYGEAAEFIKGKPSQCHMNSSLLWEAEPDDLVIMTGYALSLDGMWRQHSWCLRQSTQRLIETTVPRLAYYGFCLSHEEAEQFTWENAW